MFSFHFIYLLQIAEDSDTMTYNIPVGKHIVLSLLFVVVQVMKKPNRVQCKDDVTGLRHASLSQICSSNQSDSALLPMICYKVPRYVTKYI